MTTAPAPRPPAVRAPNGTAFDGTARKGTDLRGTGLDGTALNGTAPHGTAPVGTAPVGTAPVGTALALAGVLAEVLQVERVPLDADVFADLGADSMLLARFCAKARKREDLPSPSMKDVYQHRTVSSLAAALAPAPVTAAVQAPATAAEQGLAEVLAEVLQVERVPPDVDVFADLGADSMLLARFCAKARKREDLPSPSMKDVYQHRTVRSLATALAGAASAAVAPGAPAPGALAPASAGPGAATPVAPAPADAARAPVAPPAVASRGEHVLCGTLQLMAFLAYSYVAALAAVAGYGWVDDATGVVDTYERSVVFGGATFLGASLVPVLAKWVLIGRWQAQEIRIWSLAYVRFWIVKVLLRTSPMARLTGGSPLYAVYLRALGARVGRGVVVFTGVPLCTDLISIGDGTVISKDTAFTGYRALGGVLQTGPVTLGKDVFVSESTVLDIRTAMGDGAQLGHRSSLHAGQVVPAGERWHGSPGTPTSVDFRTVGPAVCGPVRRVLYPLFQLMATLLVYLPLGLAFVGLLAASFPGLSDLVDPGPLALTSSAFYQDLLVGSLVLLLLYVLWNLLLVLTVPRVLARAIRPDTVYALFGVHYAIHRAITRLSNNKFLMTMFGDSSYAVPYLRTVGYELSGQNTGSNFGTGVKHETPYHVTIGPGTMIADGLSINNADYSSTAFRVSRVTIGSRNFLGNSVAYPSQGRTGDNCLLATKVMVPIDGAIREGVGLLGSPSFEIPRSVERDATLDDLLNARERRRKLEAKNRYNLCTMAVFLLVRWVTISLLVLVSVVGVEFHDRFGAVAVAGASVLALLLPLAWAVLVERAIAGFRPLQPQFCSIYTPYFWWHERYWKFLASSNVLNGTPFRPMLWRLSGVRMGRRVWDDGVGIPERTLVTVGDGCALNAGSEIQGHSQEDGAFKSDRITVGAGCTLGVGTLVHYGATVGDGAVIGCDSFVMKGEEVPPGARWAGNPATAQPDDIGIERALPAQRER